MEWPLNTGPAGGLGKNHMVEPEETEVDGHWTNEGLLGYGPREDNQPCALVRSKGCIVSPMTGVLSLGDLHWVSWSEVTREVP